MGCAEKHLSTQDEVALQPWPGTLEGHALNHPEEAHHVPSYRPLCNPTTTLHLKLPTSGPVSLTIYNVVGQGVRTLMNRSLEAGYHTSHWDGRDKQGFPVTSGVYLYRLRTNEQVIVGKMALMR